METGNLRGTKLICEWRKRRSAILPFAILLISVFLYTGCDFIAAPQNSVSKKQDLPCSSVLGKLPNLDLSDISTEALPYLGKYSLPGVDGVAFCRYLERLQHDHEVKVEEGLLDMMGDYFLTTQKIETGYYFSYKFGFTSPVLDNINTRCTPV